MENNQTMKASELRIGNLIYSPNGEVAKVNYETIRGLVVINPTPSYTPIPLTEKWLLRMPKAIEQINHPLIGNSFTIDIGRFRRIVVSNVDNGNQMITIQAYDKNDYRKTTDLVVIWNCDYDGRISVHKFQNIIYELTNQELEIKES